MPKCGKMRESEEISRPGGETNGHQGLQTVKTLIRMGLSLRMMSTTTDSDRYPAKPLSCHFYWTLRKLYNAFQALKSSFSSMAICMHNQTFSPFGLS
jgi:hypothetical protein